MVQKEAVLRTQNYVQRRFVQRRLIGKRAASVWIAYVLLMAFVVSLSAVMFSFMTDYTRSATKDIKKTVFNTEECHSVSLSVESACFASQVLNITVQNRNYLRIDKLDFRLYDLAKKPRALNITNITINPNRKKTITVNTGMSQLGFVEVVPVILKQAPEALFEIVCSDRKASTTSFNSSC
ncbi:hypothetical protein HZB03_02840 [Candidatus Woesearchaeota archaeon]|nr:hypothetical protein [Candidatus Woesearchaeota archaeon]